MVRSTELFLVFTSRKSRLSNKNNKSSLALLFPVGGVAAVAEVKRSLTIACIRLLSLDADADRCNVGGGCLLAGMNDISFGC